MAEPKRRQRPKGAEIRDSLKPKKAIPAVAEQMDPFFSRNEFKPGFYTQKDQPPITAETIYGKGTTRSLEYPTVDPDTKMIQDTLGMSDGGLAGQYPVQVKKVPFKGVF